MTTTLAGKHTAGLWEVDADFFEGWHNGSVRAIAIFKQESDGSGWPVAWAHPYGYKQDTAVADAQLIAAAPELLAALEATLQTLGVVPPNAVRAQVMLMAQSAIAKARGEAL